MALRFCDSFDHYTTLTQKYTAGSAVIAAGSARTGVQGLSIAGTQYAILSLDAQGTWIVGIAKRFGGLGAVTALIRTLDVAATQGQVRINADATLSVCRGAAAVATSTRSVLGGVWYYIEFKHIINNVGGTLEVRVDGEAWATFNGDTQDTANAFANQITFGSLDAAFTQSLDDLYILDGVDQSIADPNSPPNNDYLGDTQVGCIVSTGAGFYTELATLVGAPTHWQAEDEVPPDEDVSYVEDSVVNARDTFTFGNLAVVSATIPGIQILTRARKTAAGAANFARLYRNAAADNQGVDTVLQTSYAYHREILGGDPIAAGVWTVPNVNSLEMGFRVR